MVFVRWLAGFLGVIHLNVRHNFNITGNNFSAMEVMSVFIIKFLWSAAYIDKHSALDKP